MTTSALIKNWLIAAVWAFGFLVLLVGMRMLTLWWIGLGWDDLGAGTWEWN